MISIALGLLIGTLYGLFFVTQQRRALSFDPTNFTRHLITSIMLSSLRLLILSLCILYILHSSIINLILVLISFILAFGYIVNTKLKQRNCSYVSTHLPTDLSFVALAKEEALAKAGSKESNGDSNERC
jgi:uncharacterized membrane protein